MKSAVSIFPIDRPLMESLGIYDNSTLAPRKSLTKLLGTLYDAGYTEVNNSTFAETEDGIEIYLHVTMPKDENGRHYKKDKHGMCHYV